MIRKLQGSIIFTLFLLVLPILNYAQFNQTYSQAEIADQIEKLGKAANVLYVAAHPDDENTSLISYFSNKEHYTTNYLSLTRGDGGQNLIGTEIRELLGVIRTQELQAARRIDGGVQYFTRANDFGFSKNADETLEIWDREKVLADVVWTIRKTRPDIIINRFDHNSNGKTHGHHTSSAILSVEAFDLAADPTAFPEQLQYVKPWQAKRMFFNTSWWFYGSIENFRKANKTRTDSLNIGIYLPNLGTSNSEISARSRSMHKCQGFGRAGTRGEDFDYLEFIKGDYSESGNLMDGVNTSLDRLDSSGKLHTVFNKIKESFNVEAPAITIKYLLEFMEEAGKIQDLQWREIKLKQAEELLKNISGLFLMASAEKPAYTPGDSAVVELEVIARNYSGITISGVKHNGRILNPAHVNLDQNIRNKSSFSLKIPADIAYTSPYWLNESWTEGMYSVSDQEMRGIAENNSALSLQVELLFNESKIIYDVPVIYNASDPVKGEIFQPLAILPGITMNIESPVYVYSNMKSKSIIVNLKAWKDDLRGNLTVALPEGWHLQGIPEDIEFKHAGDEKQLSLTLTPPAEASEGFLRLAFNAEGTVYNQRVDVIDYDHIPKQYVLQESTSKIVKIDLEIVGNKIGYIDGAGDQIPFALRQMGYEVISLGDKEILSGNLDDYDAIVTGIRAYNTNERIATYQAHLLDYVKNGGTLVVQYNTSRGLLIDEIGPYPIQLSHERVTEEDAAVRFINPSHPVLNYPNKIIQSDFDNWVQERGLYFATTWDERYSPILSAHDKGEPDRKGGMLITQYGKGYYVYTGYSWFRELPAGVSGAYRIFANLVSLKGTNSQEN